MRQILQGLFVLITASAFATAQTTINGNSLALQSSGAANGTGWTLSSDGYVGTYINLTQPTAVTFTANASGTSSSGLNPDMIISIADSTHSFSVASSSLTNYSYVTPTLAAGTYFVRTQLDNQTATQTPSLTIGSLAVSGTGVSVLNSNTNTNALNAATTYATNYREGNATISLSNIAGGLHLGAGSSVQVKLASNAFNFAAAVYGNSPFTNDSQWINVGANGQNLAASSAEQINYQNAVTSNFNMIVPANAGKWINNEFTQGSVNMNLADAMTQFASQKGLSERMHNLLWNTEQPSYVNNLFAANGTLTTANKATLNSYITSRINYYLSQSNTHTLNKPRTDTYSELDVLNEPWHGQAFQDNYIGSGALGVSGVANIYSQVATAVANAGGNTRLLTNEYNVLQFSPQTISASGVASGSDPYANWYLNGVQSIQRAGGPIGGIGSELYVNTGTAVSASTMAMALNNLSVAKDPNGNPMPQSLTEFGVANGQSPSAGTYDGDLTTALTMMYGDPQATTFGYWGGVGGPHDGNGSIYALYDASYNLTSAGTTWQNWMNQWNTNTTLTTDANGNISFNGTYGLYDVIINGHTYTLNVTKGTTNYALQVALSTFAWNGGGADSNWNTAGNWSGTALTANSALTFTGTSNLAANNNTTSGTQYNGMTFNAGAGPFVIGGNSIALAGDIVNNSSSLQTVNTGLALQQTTNFNAASADLAIGGAISGAFSINKTGTHTLTLTGSNNYTGGTTITAGTLVIGSASALPANTAVAINGSSVLQLAPGTGTQNIASLSIPSTGQLDITNNSLLINYGGGSDPIATIAAYIQSGFNNGAWNGSGIVSSTAMTNANFGIGYADAADPGNPAGLAAGQIEVRYTLLGDANLDGAVNGSDFAILAANFNKAVSGWDQGDFNYDGSANGADFASLAANFNKGSGSAASNDLAAVDSFAAANGILTDVPEPASNCLLILGAIMLFQRIRSFFKTGSRVHRMHSVYTEFRE